MTIILYLEVEAAINTTISLHTFTQFFCSAAIELCHSHCSDTIFNIDWDGLTEFYILHYFYRRNKVKGYSSILYLDILSMEVTFLTTIIIYFDPFLYMLLHLKIFMNNECTTWLYEFCVMAETFKVSLFRAIYV